MSIKYIKMEIEIHGIDVKDEDWIKFLTGWVRQCVKGCLLSEKIKKFYNFRDVFDDDIKVRITEKTGEYDES